ncbi:cyclin-K [Copidosoma floridanum]|uniref:cyclin-K n=1 Tax=Copidosoma floridanum TaxID=29053 RepID=UPI0006C9AFEB|nr:cyclin-K [Copidosoma floridanum]
MGLHQWYWERDVIETDTPSRQDGLDYATELLHRQKGARFIVDCGREITKVYNTFATGVVFFHRFYMFRSFKTFPPYVTAACCLYLAGKVEETPKRCKDIIKTAKALLNEKDFASFGEDPVEEVMAMERILLQTIKFDLIVFHPYFFLKKYIKCLKANKELLQEVLQMAWNFVNDSLCTTLSIEWEPEIVAIASIHLAGKLCKLKISGWTGRIPDQKHWWDMFVQDLNLNVLDDICHRILDLYSSKDKQSNLVAYVTKAISQKTSALAEPTTPPKVESPSQQSAETSKVVTSWPPFPTMPPTNNPMQPSFTLPNLTVPPPTTHVPYPMTNLTVPPPTHFPPANLTVPPPSMMNYYDQYMPY